MRSLSRFLAIPLLVAATAVTASGEVRDKAGLFGPEAIKKANGDLDRIERDSKLPIVIETITSLEGQSMGKAIERFGEREGVKGLFVLIAAKDHKVDAGTSPQYGKYFSRPLLQDVYQAFMPDFKKSDYDAGLLAGVAKIDSTVGSIKESNGGALTPVTTRAAVPGRRAGQAPVPARPRAAGGFGLSSLVMIVLLVVGVLFVVRLLGALMGAGRGSYGGPGQGYGQGGPMRGPGYGGGGGGYGGGGGGGGGFMSSMFGGIGGALAGNWLYDRFSGGRHQQGYDPNTGAAPVGDETGAAADPDGGWVTGGEGGDWGGGDAGGGGGGGGDWGGGGGGGDWGGGGGGGGGDWGGGGGGGDGGSW